VLSNTELSFYAVPAVPHIGVQTDRQLGVPPTPAPAPVAPSTPTPLVKLAVAPVAKTVAAPVISSGDDATSVDTADWACIRWYESRDSYTEYNGGAYQFELGTWRTLTGLSGPAEDYPPATQNAAALKLYAERGWEPWSTRYVCGL
jgi:hypothetical protein